MYGAYCQYYFQMLSIRNKIKNHRRKVVGSESDLLGTLSRETNDNQLSFINKHQRLYGQIGIGVRLLSDCVKARVGSSPAVVDYFFFIN